MFLLLLTELATLVWLDFLYFLAFGWLPVWLPIYHVLFSPLFKSFFLLKIDPLYFLLRIACLNFIFFFGKDRFEALQIIWLCFLQYNNIFWLFLDVLSIIFFPLTPWSAYFIIFFLFPLYFLQRMWLRKTKILKINTFGIFMILNGFHANLSLEIEE